MSIVAFFPDIYKKQIATNIINKINDLNYSFVPVTNLHCTLLSISSKESFPETNPYFNKLIRKRVEVFLKARKKKQDLTKIKLKFNEIRPGTWHGLHNAQIPDASNGTVVAIGNPNTKDNDIFVTLANELVCYLKNELGAIFSNDYDRKFPTVWSTLGYFNRKDFGITKNFADTFNQLKIQYRKDLMKIVVDRFSLVEYSFKDLSDANTILEYPL